MKRLSTLVLGILAMSQVSAQTIWNSNNVIFTKTAPFQEDAITSGVHLTRGSNSVIYNEVTENFLDGDLNCDWTPGSTTWAYGNIADWATLTYGNLYDVNGCHPPSMVNQPMVVHIMPDNIYLQLTFTFWGSGGSGANGNYTYTRTSGSVPLAVHLTTFDVHEKGGKCQLNWITESERDNNGFEIERSADGNKFENIGFVTAAKAVSELNKYSFSDGNPKEGTNYYRLKQIDMNGVFNYSWTVKATVKANSIRVYPNPATSIIHIEGESGLWKLSNSLGSILKSGSITEKKIEIQDLPAGMYILTVINGQNVTTKNIVKL